MKTFIKIVVGNLVALMLFGFLAMMFFGAAITALFMAEEPVTVPQDAVLVVDLTANITDAPAAADLWRAIEEAVGAGAAPTYSLRTLTNAIRSAATDDRIAAVFLHGTLMPEGYGSGYSTLREFRQALLDFQESGKPVISYVENPALRDYYVTSASNRILMNPYGFVGLSGLASQQIFLKGALERYGVGVQVTQAGLYKSAVEMFTEEEMSEANRRQIEELLAGMWGEILEAIGGSRNVSPPDLQRLADSRGYLDSERAGAANLVDRIAYMDEALDELRELTGTRAGAEFPQIDLMTYSQTLREATARRRGAGSPVIAVVYIEGDIVDGEGAMGSAGGSRFAREIRKLRHDPNVRAMVVRVNSPGGSVSAAETIQREIQQARERMPVVVSFGSMAASGGYWISAEADRIFAQPNTITGSIGVFGILPNFQEIANRHGITFDEVKTARFADVFSLVRPKTEEEMERIQELVDDIYQDFLERVARGRGMSIEEAHRLAQGRIWTGAEALRLNLVDEIGGLREAIGYAGEQAGLETWRIQEFPRPAELAEILAEMFAPEHRPLVGRHPAEGLLREFRTEYESLKILNDPRGIYARLPFSLRIQ